MGEILHPPEQADPKTERAKQVQEVLDRLVEVNGWSRGHLSFFVREIHDAGSDAKMPEQYGMGDRQMAASFDPEARAITLYEAFFKQKNREHYLVHEISHGLEGLIDQTEYQKQTAGHHREWEANYVHKIKDDKLHSQERMVDDLADFLQSKDSFEMFINRLKRISPARVKAIVPPEWEDWSLDQMKEEFKTNPSFFERSSMFREMKSLYEFFDQSIRQRLPKISTEQLAQLEPGEEAYDWEDEFGFGPLEIGEKELPAGAKPKKSFLQELQENIAKAQAGKLF